MIKNAMMNNVPRKLPLVIELHFINVLLSKVQDGGWSLYALTWITVK